MLGDFYSIRVACRKISLARLRNVQSVFAVCMYVGAVDAHWKLCVLGDFDSIRVACRKISLARLKMFKVFLLYACI